MRRDWVIKCPGLTVMTFSWAGGWGSWGQNFGGAGGGFEYYGGGFGRGSGGGPFRAAGGGGGEADRSYLREILTMLHFLFQVAFTACGGGRDLARVQGPGPGGWGKTF